MDDACQKASYSSQLPHTPLDAVAGKVFSVFPGVILLSFVGAAVQGASQDSRAAVRRSEDQCLHQVPPPAPGRGAQTPPGHINTLQIPPGSAWHAQLQLPWQGGAGQAGDLLQAPCGQDGHCGHGGQRGRAKDRIARRHGLPGHPGGSGRPVQEHPRPQDVRLWPRCPCGHGTRRYAA